MSNARDPYYELRDALIEKISAGLLGVPFEDLYRDKRAWRLDRGARHDVNFPFQVDVEGAVEDVIEVVRALGWKPPPRTVLPPGPDYNRRTADALGVDPVAMAYIATMDSTPPATSDGCQATDPAGSSGDYGGYSGDSGGGCDTGGGSSGGE
jgi:uncharacterized membrane protein YgcG